MGTAALIVPRWEWRAFGERFPNVETLATAIPVRTSAETYLLALAPDVNVKIRYEQIDVKRRLRVEQGLELWEPQFKTAFPVDATMVMRLFAIWSLPLPPLTRLRYTREQFLRDVVAAIPALRVVEVTKARHTLPIDGCTVEWAALTVDGRATQTVAVEAADPDSVRRTVAALRLELSANENYVRALTRLTSRRACATAAGAQEGASS